MTPLFDSHCHLHDKRLDAVRDDVVSRAVRAGVGGCRICGTNPEDWDAVEAFETAVPGFEIRKAYGVHPWYVENLPGDWLARLRGHLERDPAAWVGEIGLDAIRRPALSAASRAVLKAQLELAAELGRPVILHGAKALDELLAACRPFAGRVPSFTVHAFGGSEEQLRAWLDFGAILSVGGAVTRSARLRRLAATIPPERLRIETDSPDMMPDGGEPAIPGTTLNQPSNLVLVARTLAAAGVEVPGFRTDGDKAIGITPPMDAETGLPKPLRLEYLRAVRRAGGVPLVLGPSRDEATVRRDLSRCGGLLLSGGGDIEPERFGESRHALCGPSCAARDAYESLAFRAALDAGMPILGICRGVQFINVALGGTLWQDVGECGVEAGRHRQPGDAGARHGMRAAAGSALAEWNGAEEFQVNSWHHQAIHELAEGLEAQAWSDDGLVEAVTMPSRRFVWGVQWHPERSQERLGDRRIFEEFVAAARR